MKLIFIILLLSQFAFGHEYVVVANKHMEDLSPSQIRAIFLKRLLFIGDMKAVPLNLDARDPLREKFEQHILEISFDRLQSYWTKEHYLGHRPPISLKSQESVKAFVKKVDGSIGYINIDSMDDSLKILYRWSE